MPGIGNDAVDLLRLREDPVANQTMTETTDELIDSEAGDALLALIDLLRKL